MKMINRFRRLFCGLILMGLTLGALPVRAEQDSVNWYRWYKDLHGYLGSVGGVLCAPGTNLNFHPDGSITAVSRDGICQASLTRLHYPLPKDAPVNMLSLPVRKRSNFPLSHRTLEQLIARQMTPPSLPVR